jgi:hypothetical protein
LSNHAWITSIPRRDPMLLRAIEECHARLPARPAAALEARRVTFLQNVVRARGFLAECLRRRGIDLAVELS